MTVGNLEEMSPAALLEVAKEVGVVLWDGPSEELVRARLKRFVV